MINFDTSWRSIVGMMSIRARPKKKNGRSKVQPNIKERYNAQPFTGPAFEPEYVAKMRAKRFARWMKNQSKHGDKIPRHIRGDA